MVKLIMVAFLSLSLAHAEDLRVEIRDFNFSYQAPSGYGSAETFRHNQKGLKDEAVQVRVEKIDEVFKFNVTGSENHQLELKDAPEFVREAEKMDITEFNFVLSESLSLNLVEGEFLAPDDELSLENFYLSCARDIEFRELQEQMISGCLRKMSVTSSYFSSRSDKKRLLNILSKTFGIRNLNFKVSNGKYDLSAEIRAQISGKAKSTGTITFDQPNKKVIVKVSEIKFGILNVTSKVFDELKKQESSSVRVHKPYVTISLD